MNLKSRQLLDKPVFQWEYEGIALYPGNPGTFDADVTGDPCIVWDKEAGKYRMFYFALQRGKGSCNAQALSLTADQVSSGNWDKLGPVCYTNPGALIGGHTHKPWIMMNPGIPNEAAVINGKFYLFTVSYLNEQKVIQAATSSTLAGPWTIMPQAVLSVGGAGSFDSYHVDTVTAYWFAEREEILIYYKGYPAIPQANQKLSPWGSSLAAALMRPDEKHARKLGQLLAPVNQSGHWLSGWVSGLQLLPGSNGGWYGLMTGSPTPPVPVEEEKYVREPAPSLGGWAFTPEAWPVSGWIPDEKPIWEINDIPSEAKADGMGVNLWRHHLLTHHSGSRYLFCNSGSYGNERMFIRKAVQC